MKRKSKKNRRVAKRTNTNKVSKSLRPNAHILVVDDDPLFCRVMQALGETSNIAVTTCQSLEELEILAGPELFDVAIIDYYLDGPKSQLTGPLVASALGTTPAVFISGYPGSRNDSTAWPTNVHEFVPKLKGPKSILKTALKNV